MTTQEGYTYENSNFFTSIKSALQSYCCNDTVFESLLSVINDEDAFVKKLYEVAVLEIKDGYVPEAYAALLEAFTVDTELNPKIIEIPKELMAVRFADRIKEAIKKYTPEYYNFVCSINYYDYRLLPIIVEGTSNHREIIETVLRDKAVEVVADFIELVFPEVEHIVEELDDELIAFIMPSILEYNKTTTADKEVVMRMIINPEALFTLKTENSEMSNVIVQTLLEQVDRKRNQSEESCDGNN